MSKETPLKARLAVKVCFISFILQLAPYFAYGQMGEWLKPHPC